MSDVTAGHRPEGGHTRKFVAGFIAGALTALASAALAARIVGGNGWLNGWEVTKDGESICEDPYVWVSTHEIECD
ncbi:MAG: hypothetical protein OHK0044_29260 [Burkholderiaceae bacterium]